MPNAHRGEIEADLDGKPHILCLTLGALAELESNFGESDMIALAERFQAGRISALDAARIIGAGLRGGGYDIADEAVARMRTPGSAAGFVDIVARLLGATFGGPAGAEIGGAIAGAISGSAPPPGGAAPAAASGKAGVDPFPGAR